MIENIPLEQQPNNDKMLIDIPSSPNAAKPPVGCCTSVELLIKELERRMYIVQSETTELREQMIIDLVRNLDEYLELEQSQIVDAFKVGILNANYSSVSSDEIDDNANEYFNNTFKK